MRRRVLFSTQCRPIGLTFSNIWAYTILDIFCGKRWTNLWKPLMQITADLIEYWGRKLQNTEIQEILSYGCHTLIAIYFIFNILGITAMPVQNVKAVILLSFPTLFKYWKNLYIPTVDYSHADQIRLQFEHLTSIPG